VAHDDDRAGEKGRGTDGAERDVSVKKARPLGPRRSEQ